MTVFDPSGLLAGDVEPLDVGTVTGIRNRRGEAPLPPPTAYDVDVVPAWCAYCGVHKAAAATRPCPVCAGAA